MEYIEELSAKVAFEGYVPTRREVLDYIDWATAEGQARLRLDSIDWLCIIRDLVQEMVVA